jgi:putative endonuclease
MPCLAQNNMRKKNLGNFGENIAAGYLKNNGYKVLFRNYFQGKDEIDIIARENDRTLVFIEVKTMYRNNLLGITPENNFTKQKEKKVNRSAQVFVLQNPDLVDGQRGWRIDLIAVKISGNNIALNHYKNV